MSLFDGNRLHGQASWLLAVVIAVDALHIVAVLSVLLSLFSNSCLVCTDGEARLFRSVHWGFRFPRLKGRNHRGVPRGRAKAA